MFADDIIILDTAKENCSLNLEILNSEVEKISKKINTQKWSVRQYQQKIRHTEYRWEEVKLKKQKVLNIEAQ